MSVHRLLTMSCVSVRTSTWQPQALSAKASLKSSKRTRQQSLGVTPFSLFSNREAAFSSWSHTTREISAKVQRHTKHNCEFYNKYYKYNYYRYYLTQVENMDHGLQSQCVIKRNQGHGVSVAGQLCNDPLPPTEGDKAALLHSRPPPQTLSCSVSHITAFKMN